MATPAAAPQGLQISPIRRELKVDPGTQNESNIVVANLTKQNLNITLYFREFSVTDTSYNYSFNVSHYDWVRIATPTLTLKPGQSQTVPFTLTPDKDASPGGYYFTIFASSDVQSNGVDSTIQAASLLYTTVNGTLNKSARLDRVDFPYFLFSPDITYDFTMTDTGNVYYTIYTTASLGNIFDSSEAETAAHTVLPGKPRQLSGTLPAPKLPGIYTATIGYHTDEGMYQTVSHPVLYLPLWGVVIVIGIVIVLTSIIRRIIRRRRFR